MNERAEEVEAVQDEDNPCQEHYVCLQCMGVNYLERKTSRDDKTRSAICEYCSKFYKLI